jgi:hypothetical protein
MIDVKGVGSTRTYPMSDRQSCDGDHIAPARMSPSS